MARVLAYNAPATGHIFPCAGMLLELHGRGHEVHLRTRGSDVATLAALGLRTAPVDPRLEAIELDDWQGRNPVDALERLQRTAMAWAELEIPDLSQAIDDARPDVLIVDAMCEGAAIAAEASALPWAQYSPFPPVFRSKDAPPYGPGLRPLRGPIGRMRDGVAGMVLDRIANRHLPPVNVLRAGAGLEPLRRLEEVLLRAPRFILFTAEPYEYPRRNWPASARLVGPIEWEPPSEPPPWLAEETGPIVLVTASTVRQGDDKLIATALEALADEDMLVVATTAALDPDQFDVPVNARVERFLPHGPLLAHAACVVSHGGQGTTQKALAAGVPVCAVPFCRDQFEVARRVEVSGSGVRLHHKRLSPERLRRAVAGAMSKRDGAERVAAAFATSGGASAAADAVEELLTAVDAVQNNGAEDAVSPS
jgi:UDP:flavonoid glycosyltransferase YjiC (YdhE family)